MKEINGNSEPQVIRSDTVRSSHGDITHYVFKDQGETQKLYTFTPAGEGNTYTPLRVQAERLKKAQDFVRTLEEKSKAKLIPPQHTEPYVVFEAAVLTEKITEGKYGEYKQHHPFFPLIEQRALARLHRFADDVLMSNHNYRGNL
jgi:hypothetical protein